MCNNQSIECFSCMSHPSMTHGSFGFQTLGVFHHIGIFRHDEWVINFLATKDVAVKNEITLLVDHENWVCLLLQITRVILFMISYGFFFTKIIYIYQSRLSYSRFMDRRFSKWKRAHGCVYRRSPKWTADPHWRRFLRERCSNSMLLHVQW